MTAETMHDLPPPVDRQVLASMVPELLSLAGFALFGGLARMLAKWDGRPWQRKLGDLMATILITVPTFYALSSVAWFQGKIGVIGLLLSLVTWGGREILDTTVRLAMGWLVRAGNAMAQKYLNGGKRGDGGIDG